MSREQPRLGLAFALFAVIVFSSAVGNAPPPARASAVTWPTYRSPAGVLVTYPPDWYVAVSPSGMISVAGPRAGWGRPSVAISAPQDGASASAVILDALKHPGVPQPLKLLGVQQLGVDRAARYYVSGEGDARAYIVIGAVAHNGRAVVLIGVDSVRDPDLRVRANVLQTILLRLVLR